MDAGEVVGRDAVQGDVERGEVERFGAGARGVGTVPTLRGRNGGGGEARGGEQGRDEERGADQGDDQGAGRAGRARAMARAGSGGGAGRGELIGRAADRVLTEPESVHASSQGA